MVKNQGTKQREQRTPGYCWQWKANGQCSKGDNCSFRHDMNKRAKSTQPSPSPRSSTRQNERNASRTRSPRGKSPSGRMSRLPTRIASKELAPIHSVKSGIFPGDPHQRNPNAPKFEDRSQEETEWQERCAREAAWRLAK